MRPSPGENRGGEGRRSWGPKEPLPLLESGCFPSRHSECPPALSHVKVSLPRWAWWLTHVILTLGRLTRDCLCNEFQAADMVPVSHTWAWGHVVIALPGASLIHGGARLWHRKSKSRTSVPTPRPPLPAPTPRSHVSRECVRYRVFRSYVVPAILSALCGTGTEGGGWDTG